LPDYLIARFHILTQHGLPAREKHGQDGRATQESIFSFAAISLFKRPLIYSQLSAAFRVST